MRTLSGAIIIVASALFFVGDGLAHSGTRDVGMFVSMAVGILGFSVLIIGLATDKKGPDKPSPER